MISSAFSKMSEKGLFNQEDIEAVGNDQYNRGVQEGVQQGVMQTLDPNNVQKKVTQYKQGIADSLLNVGGQVQ